MLQKRPIFVKSTVVKEFKVNIQCFQIIIQHDCTTLDKNYSIRRIAKDVL